MWRLSLDPQALKPFYEGTGYLGVVEDPWGSASHRFGLRLPAGRPPNRTRFVNAVQAAVGYARVMAGLPSQPPDGGGSGGGSRKRAREEPASAPSPGVGAPALWQNPPPPEWEWMIDGERLEVEAEVAPGDVRWVESQVLQVRAPRHSDTCACAWYAQPPGSPVSHMDGSRCAQVLVDGSFQALVQVPQDPFEDWFTWEEEGKDWRRIKSSGKKRAGPGGGAGGAPPPSLPRAPPRNAHANSAYSTTATRAQLGYGALLDDRHSGARRVSTPEAEVDWGPGQVWVHGVAADALQQLRCSVCLEYVDRCVTAPCMHRFCKGAPPSPPPPSPRPQSLSSTLSLSLRALPP